MINTGQMVWKYDSKGSSDQFKNKMVTWNLNNLNGTKVSNGFYTCTFEITTDKLQAKNVGQKFMLK